MIVILESVLGGLLRYVLAGVISWLITNGIANEEQVAQLLVGLTSALVLASWMIWNKVRAHVKVLTALAVPKGTTLAELDALMNKGLKVPAATPSDAVPVPKREQDTVTRKSWAWLLPMLLTGSMVATTSCAGFLPAPVVTPNAPAAVTLDADAINKKAVEFAAVGTAVLALAQRSLEFSHVVIPPSQLRLDINDANEKLGGTLKDLAIRAKSIVDEPTLRRVYQEVLDAADAYLAALGRWAHPQLAEYSTAIRNKLQFVRAFLTGGSL